MQRWSLVVTGLLAIALAFTMIRGCESTSVTSPAEVSDLVGPNPLEQARHDESALQRVPRSRLPTADDADTIERDSVRWRLRVTLVFAGARIDRPARVLVASEAWSGRAQDSAPTLIADAAGTCTVDLEYFRRLHVHERSDVRLQILVHAVGFAPYRAVGITLGDTSPAEPLLIEHEARLEAGSWLVARITDATDRPVPDALVFSHATTFPTSIDDREAAFAGFSDALGEVRVDTTGRRVLRLAAHHPDHGH